MYIQKRNINQLNFKTMKTMAYYQQQFPDLTFYNEGYEYLPASITIEYASIIGEIEAILKQVIEGFVKFNNFRVSKDGAIEVRVQHYWSDHFCGVGYFSLNEVDNYIKTL